MPLALAQSCALLGRFYEGTSEDDKKRWNSQAKGWYEKAFAAQPDDLAIVRRMIDFFVQTRQMPEAEAQLSAILDRTPNPQNAELKAWAKRTLPLALASSPDPEKVRRALTVLEGAPDQKNAKPLEDPEDLRALARVLDMQRTREHRERARFEVLESLVKRNLASTDDRFNLGRLEEARGDWPKALKHYRDLISRTKNPRDTDSLNRRCAYLTQCAAQVCFELTSPETTKTCSTHKYSLTKLPSVNPKRSIRSTSGSISTRHAIRRKRPSN